MTHSQLVSNLHSLARMFKFHRDVYNEYAELANKYYRTGSDLADFYKSLAAQHARAAHAYRVSVRFITLSMYPTRTLTDIEL